MVNKRRKKKELPIEAIVKEWEKGKTQRELGEEYGVSQPTIFIRINEYYKERGIEKPVGKKELPIEEIVEKWEKGKSQKELGEEYGVSRYTIFIRINEYYKERGIEKPVGKKELPIEEIVEKWEKGKSQKELGEEYGVSQYTISIRINEYYKETSKNCKVLNVTSIVIEYLEKGLTAEQIELIALKKNIIIPKNIMEKAVKEATKKAGEEKLKNASEFEGR